MKPSVLDPLAELSGAGEERLEAGEAAAEKGETEESSVECGVVWAEKEMDCRLIRIRNKASRKAFDTSSPILPLAKV